MVESKKHTPEALEERKRKYAQKQSETNKTRRAERKREKLEGQTDSRRLAFLSSIMSAYGYTQQSLAEALGCTPQNIYWIFSVRDDCSLSKAEEIMCVFNLSLKVELKPSAPQKAYKPLNTCGFTFEGNVKNRIEGNLPILKPSAKYPKYITECPTESRVRFLADFLISLGKSISTIEKECEWSHGNIMGAFEREDITISKIYKLAQCGNAEIIWHVDELGH